MTNRVKLALYVGVVMLGLFATNVFVAAGPSDRVELEAFLDSVVEGQLKELGLVGATVSVVSDGEVLLSKGYGYANVADGISIDGERTLFRVGSISKLFVWTSVMQLVEQGKLDLETDVNTYLDFELPNEILGAAGKTAPPITLTHLMTHTAGFEDVGSGLFQLSEDQMTPLSEYVRTHLPARVFSPGELAAYSNYSSALAAYIVELVSGQPFADYVEQHILEPLGMERSTFRQPIPEHLASDVAWGYRFIDGEAVASDFLYVLEAPGALSSTASDMARFMLAHLQGGVLGGERILQEETARKMRTRLFSQHPLLDGSAYGFFEYTVNGHRALFHPGAVILFNSALYLLPEEGVGLFVSYNGDSYTAAPELFQAFMDYYYPASVETTSVVPPEGAVDKARAFAGEYHIGRRSFTGDDALLSLLDTMQIEVDADGYLVARHVGEVARFVEIEPGIYRNTDAGSSHNPYGAFRTLVFEPSSLGQMALLSDGPMSYTKAPWYATSKFTIVALVGTMIILMSAPIVWLGQLVVRRVRKQEVQRFRLSQVARGATAVFSLLAVVFVAGLLAVTGEMHPVFQLPMAYFDVVPAWSSALDVVPVLMGIVLVGMIGLTVAAWRRNDWRIAGRIHYTVVTLSAVVLLATLRYWNLV